MIISNERDIIQICEREEWHFRNIIQDLNYEIKGILNSEMLFFCSVSKFLKVTNIIESGRARGYSTEVLANFFKNHPLVSIHSIEYLKYTEDSLIAMKRLHRYRNINLCFGNAFSLLPRLTQAGPCTVLIDGPKGKYAVQLAAFLLKKPMVKAVFIHDLYKPTKVRSIVGECYPDVFSSDNLNFVKRFSLLDESCWEVYKNWEGYTDWGPYKRGKLKMKSYGPTLTMILNRNEGIDREKEVLDRLELRRIRIQDDAVKNILRKVRTFLPKFSEIPYFLRYYLVRLR